MYRDLFSSLPQSSFCFCYHGRMTVTVIERVLLGLFLLCLLRLEIQCTDLMLWKTKSQTQQAQIPFMNQDLKSWSKVH